jgi:hypothetical protein
VHPFSLLVGSCSLDFEYSLKALVLTVCISICGAIGREVVKFLRGKRK